MIYPQLGVELETRPELAGAKTIHQSTLTMNYAVRYGFVLAVIKAIFEAFMVVVVVVVVVVVAVVVWLSA